MRETEVPPGGALETGPDGGGSQRAKGGKRKRKTKGALKERQRLKSERNTKRRNAGFDVQEVKGRRTKAARDDTASSTMNNLQLRKMGRISEREPTRGSVREDREKKGLEERS